MSAYVRSDSEDTYVGRALLTPDEKVTHVEGEHGTRPPALQPVAQQPMVGVPMNCEPAVWERTMGMVCRHVL